MAEPTSTLPTCSNCDRRIGRLEQRYEIDGHLVCAGCAATLSEQYAPPAESGGDEVEVADDGLSALASATATRRTAPPKKRSPLVLVGAFLGGTLLVGGVLYGVYASGAFEKASTSAKSVEIQAQNELVGRYNEVIKQANDLARARKFADAAAKLRLARSMLEQHTTLPEATPAMLAELAGKIEQYERMALGKDAPAVPGTPAPGVPAAPPAAPAVAAPDIDFMKPATPAPAAPPAAAVAPLPALPPPVAPTGVTPPAIAPLPGNNSGTIPLPDDAILEESPAPAPDAAPAPAPATPGGLPTVIEAPLADGPANRPAAPPAQEPPAPAIPVTPVPAPRAPAAAIESNDPDAIASQAWEKMRSGDVETADELFKKSLSLSATHDKSTVGHAVWPAFAGKPQEAIARLEKLANQRVARVTAINLASLHLADNPMRAARVLRDHLLRPGTTIDETVVNYLGVAIRQAERGGESSAMLRELASAYERSEARLAAGKPGKKRWGSEWLDAADADRKRATLERLRSEMTRTAAAHRASELRAERARQQLNDRQLSREAIMGLRQGIAEAEKVAADAKAAAEQAKKAYDSAEQPPLPETIPIVEP